MAGLWNHKNQLKKKIETFGGTEWKTEVSLLLAKTPALGEMGVRVGQPCLTLRSEVVFGSMRG